jgi:hypothetical protein
MQKLMAERSLDLAVVATVLADEVQIDQQRWPILTCHGERRHFVGKSDFTNPQYGADRKGILVHEFLKGAFQAVWTHA